MLLYFKGTGPACLPLVVKSEGGICGKATSSECIGSTEGRCITMSCRAESQEEAAGYFIGHCRDDVSLVRVELVGPDDGGVREYAHSPISPFDPLRARRRMDKDEDAR